MSTSTPIPAPETGKPSPGLAAPVIRRVTMNEEDTATRVLNRHLPAWVISGGIHVVIIGIFVFFVSFKNENATANQSDKIVTTEIKDKEEKGENFENIDMGFDPDLAAATNSPREEIENIEGPTNLDEPIGIPTESNEQPTQTFAPPGLGPTDLFAGSKATPSNTGANMVGERGGGSTYTGGFKGRSGATKNKMVQEGGGNALSEAAVARGLKWLSEQQKPDGRWVFDGRSSDDSVAATGLALLPYLAAGITHKSSGEKDSKKYISVVSKGLTWLAGRVRANGEFTGSSGMYSQAIATIALCEAYGMTEDPNLKIKAQAAASFIVKAQASNGSWGYGAGQDGDTSIVGWQIQALRSAKTANLAVPDKVWKGATDFLNLVGSESNSQYGYRQKGGTPTLSAVGLLARQYMGWGPQNPSLAKGVQYLKETPPVETFWDMYYYYYATQVIHFFDGPVWSDFWNPKMRDMLIKLQEKNGVNQGRWPKDKSHIGTSCGHLGTTCLALLTLEVYYRHLPLYKRSGAGGIDELER